MEESIALGIFCYNRPHKLKSCVDALLKNPECPVMEVVFFSDGPKNADDEINVQNVRTYIDQLVGFKNIIKIYRDENLTTGPNFEDGLKFLSNRFEKFIVVEDDLVVSENYISFLLGGLEFYKDFRDVFCITGYVFPMAAKGYEYDSIVYNRFCSWGWASWTDRLTNVVWDKQKLLELSEKNEFKKRLNAKGNDLYRMLKKQISGAISTWDIQMQVHVSENNLKVIYPVVSKVNNVGFDKESTNTFGMNYLKTPIDNGRQRKFKFCKPYIIVAPLQRQISKPYSLSALVHRKIFNELIKVVSKVKDVFKKNESPNQFL